MESRKRESLRPIPERRERLNDALELLSQFRAAKSPEEAQHMFALAFQEAERLIPKKERVLNLPNAEIMRQILHEGRRIRVSAYKSHILFLGENGAIEVRLFPRVDGEVVTEEEFVQRHDDFRIVFEKAGADGKKLWE